MSINLLSANLTWGVPSSLCGNCSSWSLIMLTCTTKAVNMSPLSILFVIAYIPCASVTLCLVMAACRFCPNFSHSSTDL
eukprot:2533525-Ditylum_brightwellii.AAC.1